MIVDKNNNVVARSLKSLRRYIAKNQKGLEAIYTMIYRKRTSTRKEIRKDGKVIQKAKTTNYEEKRICYKALLSTFSTKGRTIKGKRVGGGTKICVKLLRT